MKNVLNGTGRDEVLVVKEALEDENYATLIKNEGCAVMRPIAVDSGDPAV